MTTGARSTEQWREHRALLEAIQRGGPVGEAEAPAPAPPPPPPAAVPDADPDPVAPPRAERIGAIVLAVAALLWLAAVVTGLQAEAAPVAVLVARVSEASGPLALFGIAYLLLQRTSRREARRFGRTAAAMRAEALALETVMTRLGDRLADDRRAVTEHTQALAALGEDTALRLSEIGVTMRRETQALAHQSERLEGSAAGLFSDLGVVLTDLPRLEAQVETLATRLGETGRDAHDRVRTLSGELTRLAAEARDADEVAGGAAQRLGAHLARIESLSGTAATRIDEAADGIARTVDTALARTAQAVDATRTGVDAQGAALLALVDQGRAAFEHAGAGAAGSLEARVAAVRAETDRLADRLTVHDAAGHALVASLAERVAAFDRAFAEVDRQGAGGLERLGEMLTALGENARSVGATLGRSGESADALIARGEQLRALIEETSAYLAERLPSQLAEVDAGAQRGRASIAEMAPAAEAAAAGVTRAARAVGRMDATVTTQRKAIEALAATADERFAVIGGQARELDALLTGTIEQARTLTESASGQLIDALLRVRETAGQAADHAGRAFGTVIRDAAQRLGEESRQALAESLGDTLEVRLAEIAALAERAAAAGEAAGARLTGQTAALTRAVEAIDQRRTEDEETTDGKGMSARVAQIIDQLNSAAIDVTRLLANDVPDTYWAAYLKGDRGIFTRRAARLVETADAREIARRYEEEPAFRAQVNRYIHDFEAMLRHILAARDGSMLGVTLLSADMGKLYVALAQAIERLRA